MTTILQEFELEIINIYKAYRMSHFSLYNLQNNFYDFKRNSPQIKNFIIEDIQTSKKIKFNETEIQKNSEDGLYQRILAGNTIAMFYNLWEDKYREKIANHLEISKGDLKNDFFGDLRLIRISIMHNNYNAISELNKIKLTKFIYQNNHLKLTSMEVGQLYDLLMIQIANFKISR